MFDKYFYRTDIRVYRKVLSGAYDVSETVEDICTVKADVQPYSGALAREEYGLDADKSVKIFCENDSRITEGVYVSVNGVDYIVKYAARYDMSYMFIAVE